MPVKNMINELPNCIYNLRKLPGDVNCLDYLDISNFTDLHCHICISRVRRLLYAFNKHCTTFDF